MKRNDTRKVTRYLRELATEAETISDDGTMLTKAEVLARLLWRKALGWTEQRRTKDDVVEIIHQPESWAINLVYDRLEGRVPQQLTDESEIPTVAERVGDLAKARMNKLAQAVVDGDDTPKAETE